MKKCPRLILLLLLGFTQALVLKITNEDKKILKYINLNTDFSSEEFQYNLRSRHVPLVLNPTEDAYPPKFSAAIFRDDRLIGAGAIISEYFVLTICSVLRPKWSTRVDLSSFTKIKYPFFKIPNQGLEIATPKVKKVVTHPGCSNYHKIDPITDVGLIQTEDPMEESKFIKYPKFPTFPIPEKKAKFIISNVRINNPAAININEAIWYVFTKPSPKPLCKKLFTGDKQNYSSEGNICMSYMHIGDGNQCRGDLGAPLSIRYQNQDYLIGLNIHKHQCGQPRELAAFVCVKTNKEWIEETMNDLKHY